MVLPMKTLLIISALVMSGTVFAQPPAFPSVDTATQIGRDAERRRILQDELAAEERALVSAKSFADIDLHTTNIAALKSELSRLQLPGLAAPGTQVKLKAVPVQKPQSAENAAPVPYWDVYRRR